MPTSPSVPRSAKRLEATFPDHKTVILEGAGLYTESDAPEEFVAAIRDWRFAPDGRRTPSARGDGRRTRPAKRPHR